MEAKVEFHESDKSGIHVPSQGPGTGWQNQLPGGQTDQSQPDAAGEGCQVTVAGGRLAHQLVPRDTMRRPAYAINRAFANSPCT